MKEERHVERIISDSSEFFTDETADLTLITTFAHQGLIALTFPFGIK